MDSFTNSFTSLLKEIPAGSALGEWIRYFTDIRKNAPAEFDKDYLPIIQEEEKSRTNTHPFLSVITRTQGRRPEMLRETFLSLAGQINEDFEVVLVAHKPGKQIEMIKDIISELEPSLRAKIRLFELNYGTRTTPLNFGFAHARGEYAAILDDDDIVLDHWVDEFHKAAEKNSGKILHAYTFSQKWMTVATDENKAAVRAVSAPETIYCTDFDLLTEIRTNYCPPVGLAFPLFYFRKLGVIFDEKMTTTEDWDYLMRVAFLSGVYDIKEPTSIYRLWTNAENSQTVHSQKEWAKNYAVIQDKIMNMPVLIPGGNRKALSHESMMAIDSGARDKRFPVLNTGILYIDSGEGFSENEIVYANIFTNGILFDVDFDCTTLKEQHISKVRFDPSEEGMIGLMDVVAVIKYKNKVPEFVTLEGSKHNGYGTDERVYFLEKDPWIVWETDTEEELESVRIIGKIMTEVTGDVVREICRTNANESLQLFYSSKTGDFSEDRSLKKIVSEGPFCEEFDLPASGKSVYLRLDPGENALRWIRNLKISYCDNGGNWNSLDNETLQTNGIQYKDEVFFTDSDPQILWQVTNANSVRIQGILTSIQPEQQAVLESWKKDQASVDNRTNSKNKARRRLF